MEPTASRWRRLHIAMVSDYFYPKIGGVESHIYMLSQKLIQRGHKVVIITHQYGDRCGIRHLPAGLKVYHIPMAALPFLNTAATIPNLFACLPLVRSILLRETIQIVHAHQALSSMGLESLMHARNLETGARCVFTDHSLFGLGGGGWGEVTGNKMLKGVLSDVEGVICVSHTGKENTVLRAALNPDLVHVIPNAIVPASFTPDPSQAESADGIITIVCVSRLAYRKGIDLLIAAIPLVCAADPRIRFIIGGDGPKSIELEQMREKHQTLLNPPQPSPFGPPGRLLLLGSIHPSAVRDVLVRGHIFLNTSLTEAFCMGILEAASCGLFVVSTKVGGIPEVLPEGLIEFAEPEIKDLVKAIQRGIAYVRSGQHDPIKVHDMVKDMYSWDDIAYRTERVYLSAMDVEPPPLVERLRRYYGCGKLFGKIMCIVVMCQIVLMGVLDWMYPREEMDEAPSFDYEGWKHATEAQEVD